MKLVNESGTELVVKRYDLPRKFSPGKANIDGVDQDIYQTEWKGIFYTYFLYKNVAVWVPGQLGAGAWTMKDVPEGWGADKAPEPRKTYSTKKVEYEQDVNEDGTPATNEDGSPRYKLDAEGKPIVKVKPPKAPKAKKAPKAEASQTTDGVGSGGTSSASEHAEQAAEASATPMRRRRGGEASAAV